MRHDPEQRMPLIKAGDCALGEKPGVGVGWGGGKPHLSREPFP